MAAALSRREFMKRSGLAVGGVAIGSQALAACAPPFDGLYFANWPAYIDEETVDLFREETGLAFKYTEEYNDNNEYFAKIQPRLSRGNTVAPDLIAPTFWMAARLIGLGWVEKLPLDDIPNTQYLNESLVQPTWDPTGEYSLPWQSGFAGIAYNIDVTGRELTSIDDLWDPKFKGKIGVLTEMRDTVGLIAMSLGIDIAEPTAKKLQPALDVLKEKVDSGQIRAFTGNDYMDDLSQGNFAACVGWSGDIAQLRLDNPSARFAIPESGGTLWSDTMVVLKGADNVAAAAQWMDYCYDPVNAARIAAYVQYVSPVQGVQDQLRKMGPDEQALADNELLFPSEEATKNLFSFGQLSDDDEAAVDAAYSKIQGN